MRRRAGARAGESDGLDSGRCKGGLHGAEERAGLGREHLGVGIEERRLVRAVLRPDRQDDAGGACGGDDERVEVVVAPQEVVAVNAYRAAEERDRPCGAAEPRQGAGDVVPFASHDLAHGLAADRIAGPPARDRQGLVQARIQRHAKDHG